jgi:hypothetical protein
MCSTYASYIGHASCIRRPCLITHGGWSRKPTLHPPALGDAELSDAVTLGPVTVLTYLLTLCSQLSQFDLGGLGE